QTECACDRTSLERLWQGRLDSNQRMPGSKPGALPLGDAPVSYNRMLGIHFLRHFRELAVQHRNVAPLGHESWHMVWKLAADFISLALVWKAPKHTSSSAGHSCWNEFIQQAQSVTYFWITLLDHRLAVVTTTPCKKAANCNGRGIACQLRVGKYFRCTNRDLRDDNEEPGLAQLHPLQPFADALGEGRVTAHEHRYVGAQAQPDLCQAVLAKPGLPEMVEHTFELQSRENLVCRLLLEKKKKKR